MTKICPFTRGNRLGIQNCREDCEWWLKGEQECAVRYISAMLNVYQPEKMVGENEPMEDEADA